MLSFFVFSVISTELKLGLNEIPAIHKKSKELYYYHGDLENNNVYYCDLEKRECEFLTKKYALNGLELAGKTTKYFYLYQVPISIKCRIHIPIFNGVGHKVYYEEMDSESKCLAFLGTVPMNYVFYATPYDENPVTAYAGNSYDKPYPLYSKNEISFNNQQFVLLHFDYINKDRKMTVFGAKKIKPAGNEKIIEEFELNNPSIRIYDDEDDFVCVYDGANNKNKVDPIAIVSGEHEYKLSYDFPTIVKDANEDYTVFVKNYENFQQCSKNGHCKPLPSALLDKELYILPINPSKPLQIAAFENPLGKQAVYYTNIFDKDILITDVENATVSKQIHSFFTTTDSVFEIDPKGSEIQLWYPSIGDPINITQKAQFSNTKFVSVKRFSNSFTMKITRTDKDNIPGSVYGVQAFPGEKLLTSQFANVVKLNNNEKIVTDSDFHYFPNTAEFTDEFSGNLPQFSSNSHHIKSNKDNNLFFAVNMTAAQQCDIITLLYNPDKYKFSPNKENRGKVVCLFTVAGPKEDDSETYKLEYRQSTNFSHYVVVKELVASKDKGSQLIVLDVHKNAIDNVYANISHTLSTSRELPHFAQYSTTLDDYSFSCYNEPKKRNKTLFICQVILAGIFAVVDLILIIHACYNAWRKKYRGFSW